MKKSTAFYDITNILNSLPEEDRAEVANQVASKWATDFTWAFDDDEAKGVIQVLKSHYGVYLNLPEVLGQNGNACMLDLFYNSEEGQGLQEQPFNVQVWSEEEQNDDPVYQEFYGPKQKVED